MRIECPGCAAAYEVPDAQIKPRRNVRCARCGQEWCPERKTDGPLLAGLDVPAPEPAGTPGPAPEPQPEEPETSGMLRKRCPAKPPPEAAAQAPPARRFALRAWLASPALPGWAASVLLLAGLLVATMTWRGALMREWPPSIRLYVALGVHPPGL